MTELNALIIPPYNPDTAILTQARPLEGIVKARAVTLDADHPEYARWILLDVAGPLSYVGWDGVTVVLPILSAGVFHPIFSKRVNSSGTTATNLVWAN